MMKKIDYKKLIKKNRAIDKKQLANLSTILEFLKKHGIKSEEYNILLPYTQRKREQAEEDPRTIHLRF